MLESQTLLLRATCLPVSGLLVGRSPTVRKVSILDPITGARLGSVQSAIEPASWLHWLTPEPWTVYETEDLSLVFTVGRYWRWSRDWVVRDAEAHHVGAIVEIPSRGWRLEDAYGRCLAHLRACSAETGLFVGPGGEELGAIVRREGDIKLTFGRGLTDNPFTRMLLLAAALFAG